VKQQQCTLCDITTKLLLSQLSVGPCHNHFTS